MTRYPDPKRKSARSKAQWVSDGESAIQELITTEYSVTHMEIEAKISEKPGTFNHLQPHILAQARKNLLRKSVIQRESRPTRGGRSVDTFSLTNSTASRRSVEKAAARKRTLTARYLQWASGTPGQGLHTGIVGSSLENILHESIRASSPSLGYRLNNPDTGKTEQIYDMTFGGSLDNACVWHDDDHNAVFQIVVEAKNLREWIYPWSPELYQLLSKSARLAPFAEDAGQLIVPVLVCRRAHPTLFYMAKDLGFHVVDTTKQLINFGLVAGSEEDRLVNEVRAELGMLDILDHDGKYERIVNQFVTTIPRRALEIGRTWNDVGSKLQSHYLTLRAGNQVRNAYKDLREGVTAIGIAIRSW